MKATYVLRALAVLSTVPLLSCSSSTGPSDPPGAPSGLSVVGASRSSIELSWVAPATGDVAEYEVDRTTGTAAFETVASVSGGTLAYTDGGLTEDTRYRYRVRACNGAGCSAYTDTEAARTFGVLTIVTSTLPQGAVGQPYTAAVSAVDAGEEYTYEVVAGALPAGLVIGQESGIISGTPEEEGVAQFTVQVSSVDGQTAERNLSIEIVAALPLVIENIALPPVVVGGPYDVVLNASGGGASLTWSLVSGTLPAGLSLDPGGRITGTPTTVGTAQLTLRVSSANQSDDADFSLAVVAHNTGRYDITTLDVVPVPPDIRPYVDAALARWEEVITGDLEPVTIPAGVLPAEACGGFGEAVNGTSVDDVIMMINIAPIDGTPPQNNIIGQAGPCGLRTGGADDDLPIVGFLTLDSEDLEQLVSFPDALTDLLFHEMGHILGFGTLWQRLELVEGAGTNQPGFTGNGAVDEYLAAGGSGTTVPLENQGGSGTVEGHWREGIFDREIMTGFAEQPGTDQPLSRITIASLADIGYTVDLGVADPFSITAALTTEGGREGQGRDDIYRGPVIEIPAGGGIR